jgi:glycosyltransferase involved in cell wall biosynthesis
VYVIPNGVDTNRFAPLPDTASIRAEICVGPADPVVTIVAALRPEKNHELFLDAAAHVVKRVPNAKFLVIGDGPRREPLEHYAADLGITSSVRFLGTRDDIPRLLSTSDVFALTSHNEAKPISILEAMSAGKPVVATNVGSIKEAVVDGETGYLVRPGDANAFARRLVELIEDPIRARQMGDLARNAVVENWSIEAMVHRYERLIAMIYCEKHPDQLAGAESENQLLDDQYIAQWQTAEAMLEA